MKIKSIARGLGWFGIGLGLAEVLAPEKVAKAAGLGGFEGMVALFGLREIASGIVLLAVRDPAPWLWLRVAGDGLDSALLGARSVRRNPDRHRAMLATLAVSPVVLLDLLYAPKTSRS